MTLNKQKGNMYGFITHTWNPLIGQCPHNCSYCSTNKLKKRFPAMKERYSGEVRLDKKQFHSLGEGKTIFVCAQNDLFAEAVPIKYIRKILHHCNKFPNNKYFFQTKNPLKYFELKHEIWFLNNPVLCTTIETNSAWFFEHSGGATYNSRMIDIKGIKNRGCETHITIEPIMDFGLPNFAHDIIRANPDQVNIGADTGNNNLPEPSWRKVQKLIEKLEDAGIEVWQKNNLQRLKDK